MQYVGQTKHNLQTRFRNHRYNIVHNKIEDTIGNHFNKDHHNISDMSVLIISQVKQNNLYSLLKTENFWINKLKTFFPDGLNIRDEIQQ